MDSGVREGSCVESLDSSAPLRIASDIHESAVHRFLTIAGRLVLFSVAYALACKYSAGFGESVPAPLWFPDSVLLCALLLAPKREWAWYLLAALPIRVIPANVPIWFVSATYVNDCLKAALAAYLLRRFISGSVRLNTLRQFGIYIGIAVVGLPVLSAFAGAASRLPLGNSFWPTFYKWFLGDATAALVLTPTLLYWCMDGWHELKQHPIRFLALMVVLAVSLYFTFLLPHAEYSPIVLYLPVPVLILAATRFKPLAVATAISLLALVSIISAVQGRGAFVSEHSLHTVLSMQLFLFVISIPMLFVAILVEERQVAQNELNANQIALQENYQRIQDLAGKLLSAQEDERRRLARELHDDIGQRLALLSVGLEVLGSEFPTERSAERSTISNLCGDLRSLSSDIQDLSHHLHSGVLEHVGLVAALRSLCRTIAQQHRIAVEFQADEMGKLPADVSLCLFRVAQEALNNAVKHGKSNRIEVVLNRQEDLLFMKVKDTGAGFDTKIHSNGLGLVSMQERLRLLGGKVEVKSQPGQGTEVNADLPVRKSA